MSAQTDTRQINDQPAHSYPVLIPCTAALSPSAGAFLSAQGPLSHLFQCSFVLLFFCFVLVWVWFFCLVGFWVSFFTTTRCSISQLHPSILIRHLGDIQCVMYGTCMSFLYPKYHMKYLFFSSVSFLEGEITNEPTLTKFLNLMRNFFLPSSNIHIVFPNFFIVPARVNCYLVFI